MNTTVLNLCQMDAGLTEKLNVISQNSKKEYTDFIDQISIGKENNKYWWTTPLVSRNTHLCEAFKEFCIAKLALEEISNKKVKTVIVPSDAIKNCITDNLKEKNISIEVQAEEVRLRDKLYWSVKGILKRYFDIKRAIKGMTYTFLNEFTLIDAYVESSSFKSSGYKDRAFDGILEYCGNENIWFLSYLTDDAKLGYDEFIRKMQEESKYQFLIREKFLTIGDFVVIVPYWLQCVRFMRGKKVCNGVDYTAVVNSALKAGMYNRNAYNGLLNIKLIKRLKRKYKADIKQLIGYYEGQPSSNGLFWAFRRQYRDRRNMGYIATSGLENQLGLYPSASQYKYQAVPDIYGVQGTCWKSLARQFYDNVKSQIVPSFRYRHIYDRDALCKKVAEKELKLLVVLSYFKDLSRVLIDTVLEAGRSLQNSDAKIKIYIKNHPNNTGLSVKDYGIAEEDFLDIIEYESGSMEAAIQDKDIVVLAGTSSGLEILSAGLPIILYSIPSELCEFGIPEFLKNTSCHIVYDVKQLAMALQKLQDNKISEETVNYILNEAFVPVNEKTVLQMLEGQ